MTELSEASPLKQGIDSIGQFWTSVLSDLRGGGGNDLDRELTTGTNDSATPAGDATPEMYPAGNIAWLDADGNMSFEFPFTGRLLLVESMLDDHLPDRYLDALMNC